jgi:hypothetical protein
MMSDNGQILFNTIPANFKDSEYNPGNGFKFLY